MALERTPLVSIVIPVADRADEVYRAVLSVVAQSYGNLEVLVVENNSKQPGRIHQLLSRVNDPRVSVRSLDPCPNANCARNHGVKIARGEFVAFLDSDDEWLPQHLERGLEILQREGADFLYGSILVSDGESTQEKRARALRTNERAVDYLVGKDYGWAQTSTYLMRKTIADRVRWDEALNRHQDYDFFCSVAESCAMAVDPEPTVQVNWHREDKRRFEPDAVFLFYGKWSHAMSAQTRRYYCYRRMLYFVRYGRIAAAGRLAGMLVRQLLLPVPPFPGRAG